MTVDPRNPNADPIDRIVGTLGSLQEQIDGLRDASGTELYRSVEKLTGLVNDIQAALDQYNATRYTNAEVDSRIANPPSGSAVTGDRSVTGNDSIGGSQTVTGGQTVGGNQTVQGTIDSPGTANRLVNTGTWRTMVASTTGALGYNSSTRATKDEIGPIDGADAADMIANLRPVRFVYKADDERIERIGLIAEEVADVVPEAVFYDEDGNLAGVNYDLLSIVAIAALREHAGRLARLDADLDARIAAGIRTQLGGGR